MEARSGIIFAAATEVEPEWEEEWHRWYREEHLPNLLALPGVRSGRRYQAVEGEPKHLAVYEIDAPDLLQGPAFERAARTEWTARLKPHFQSTLATYEQCCPAEGLLRGPAWAEEAVEGGLMVIRLGVAPEHEADFNAWYDQEHLAALSGVPGVIGCRRFRAIQAEPKYLAMYHLTGPEVQASAAWKRAIDTPWSERVRQTFQDRWRVVYRPL
jgi:hypothetical protein